MADKVSKVILPVKSGDNIELKEFEIRDADIAAGHLQAEVDDLNNNKAPTSHSSEDTTYGIGTATKYGHCKTINALTQSSHADGTALSAYQGKVLNDKIGNLSNLNTADKSSIVSAVDEVKTRADMCEILVVSVDSFNSLPQTVTNANIESDMVVVNRVLGTPSAQTGDWTVTTTAGRLTITGTISGSTTLTLYLAKSR